jgi:serine protease Do
MAKNVMQSLIKEGKVSRGYLGADIQEMNPQLAEMLKLEQVKGVVVAHVKEDSPAANGGMQPNDIITHYKGVQIVSSRALISLVRTTPVGDIAEVRILRDGKPKTLKITIAPAIPSIAAAETLGIEVSNIEGSPAKHFGYADGMPGVIITNVIPNSRCDQAGLEPGDVIAGINRQKIKNLKHYNELMGQFEKSDKVLLQVIRGNQYSYVVIPMR